MASKHWAALLFGLPLTIALIGILALLFPGNEQQAVLPWLLFTFPVWVVQMALMYLSRSNKRLWLILAVLTALSYGLLWLIKTSIVAA
ncbi:hypothetical protein [Rheinheimera sp.]|uniref:hypothetical protein n=1 Tax=Rheinheimera sp. TaxID=1869214 RepID=UPI00273530F0|nr:hypothetical protein [Rheinheimera sp.]MDP2716974.1 hypothetical protein [Rheinheimera sp.]